MEGRNKHILVFPFPAQGHMLPLLDLTHQLATRGLTITILVTPKNLPLLSPLLSSCPSVKTLILPFPSHPSIPVGVENSQHMPPHSFAVMMQAMAQLQEPLLHWFRTHPSPPVAIISDMFLGWTHQFAQQIGIRRLLFSPSGAMALSLIFALWLDMPRRSNPEDETEVIHFSRVPNSPKYPWWQISPIYRSYVEGDPVSEFIKDGFRDNIESWGVVINSFSELERVYLDHLKKETGHDRVWAVGPVLPPPDDHGGSFGATTQRGGSSSVSVNQIMRYLDTCEDHKVVYLCFGSQAVLTNRQTEEIASALEKSGVHFIWSVKQPTDGHVADQSGRIPPGFDDRTAGKGLVIRGWAPQVPILSHRAVGAFLTHCGWNSVLEGIITGVPLLAWPMRADQFINATLLVDQLKVATKVCEGAQTVPNSDELARILVEAVSENRVRERASRLHGAAVEAVKENGSSFKDLSQLVEQLSGLA